MAFRQFKPLNVPDHWERYWSKYPQGMTILESLFEWVSQVDSMSKNVNEWNIYLKNFVEQFDTELQKTVVKILNEWQESGFLKILISEAVQWELDDYKEKTDIILNTINTELDTINTELDTINTELDTVNTGLENLNTDVFDLKQNETIASGISLVRSWINNPVQTTTPLYFEVGDSLRASNGAHTFEYIHNVLSDYGIIPRLVATSGLKAEHFSKYTPELQPGLLTYDYVISLIQNDGFNSVVNISLGMNDISKTTEQIETYIQKIINDIKALKPQVSFILTNPNITENGYTFEKLNIVYMNLAEKNNISLINVGKNVFKEFTSTIKSMYFIDSTHPNELGQKEIGAYIVNKLCGTPTRKTKSFMTDSVPYQYHVRVARFYLRQQWFGASGRLKITQLSSVYAKPNITYLDIYTELKAAKPGVPVTNVVYNFDGVQAEQPDLLHTNIFVRTTRADSEYSVVDVFLYNRINSNRKYYIEFEGVQNGAIGSGHVVIGASAPLQYLPSAVGGSTDAEIGTNKSIVLESPSGIQFNVTVDDTGALKTSVNAW